MLNILFLIYFYNNSYEIELIIIYIYFLKYYLKYFITFFILFIKLIYNILIKKSYNFFYYIYLF